MALDSVQKRDLGTAIRVQVRQCMKHLNNHLVERALGSAEEELAYAQIRFDSIPRVALEQARRAYLAVLDDPVALEALKKELRA